jgi:hypothetical protein
MQTVQLEQTEPQTDMTKLMVALRNLANAPKNDSNANPKEEGTPG